MPSRMGTYRTPGAASEQAKSLLNTTSPEPAELFGECKDRGRILRRGDRKGLPRAEKVFP
jgi:hypothetical protein